MPIQHTTEFSATSEETIQKIATELSGSDRKYAIFKAVYSGGNRPKTAAAIVAIAALPNLTEQVVLQLATPILKLPLIPEHGGDAILEYLLW